MCVEQGHDYTALYDPVVVDAVWRTRPVFRGHVQDRSTSSGTRVCVIMQAGGGLVGAPCFAVTVLLVHVRVVREEVAYRERLFTWAFDCFCTFRPNVVVDLGGTEVSACMCVVLLAAAAAAVVVVLLRSACFACDVCCCVWLHGLESSGWFLVSPLCLHRVFETSERRGHMLLISSTRRVDAFMYMAALPRRADQRKKRSRKSKSRRILSSTSVPHTKRVTGNGRAAKCGLAPLCLLSNMPDWD